MRSGVIALIGAMILVIVTVDFAFFRDNVRGRLIANMAIVLVFGIAYVLIARR
jgi:hypothetical protein